MAGVGRPVTLRHQDLDRSTHELMLVEAEQALGLAVGHHHVARGVDDDHRVGRRLEQH